MAGYLEIEDVIVSVLKRSLYDLHTAIPGIVTDVTNYEQEQSVSVDVAVGIKSQDNIEYELTTLLDVPVVLTCGGGAHITVPIQVGDTVGVIFCERSIEDWVAGNGVSVIPIVKRNHSLSDAICIPGLSPNLKNSKPSKDHFEIKFNNSVIRIKKNNQGIDITTDSSITATCKDVIVSCQSATITATSNTTINSPTINLNGNVVIPNSLVLAGKELNGHTHDVEGLVDEGSLTSKGNN